MTRKYIIRCIGLYLQTHPDEDGTVGVHPNAIARIFERLDGVPGWTNIELKVRHRTYTVRSSEFMPENHIVIQGSPTSNIEIYIYKEKN